MLPCRACAIGRRGTLERRGRMRGLARRQRARPGRRAGGTIRVAARHRRLSRAHRCAAVTRLRLSVRRGAWRAWPRAPGDQWAIGARAPRWRLDRLAAAARRHGGAVSAGRDRGARLESHRRHRSHRAALPSAPRPRRVDRYDQLHADGDAGSARGRRRAPQRAGGAGGIAAAGPALGSERAARARHAARGTRVERAGVRGRHGGVPAAPRGGALSRVAPGGGVVRRRTHRLRHPRRCRGGRHCGRALAADDRHRRHVVPTGRGPERRHGPHRGDRQHHPRAGRAPRHLQLVLSHGNGGGRVGPLERSSAAAAVARCGRVGERERRRGARAGRIVVLDPGHPPLGARGPTGLWEPVATLAVARKVKTLLEHAGATVLLTRTDSTPLELYPRTRFAEQHDADVLVSIHANALPDGVNPFTNSGTSVYYFQPRSAALARALERALVAELGVRDLGMGRGDYALVRPTWMPAALTEGLFIMLPEQEAMLASEEGQLRYARGITRGIEDFLRQRATEP